MARARARDPPFPPSLPPLRLMELLVADKRLQREEVELKSDSEGAVEHRDTLYYLPGVGPEEIDTAKQLAHEAWQEVVLRKKVRPAYIYVRTCVHCEVKSQISLDILNIMV